MFQGAHNETAPIDANVLADNHFQQRYLQHPDGSQRLFFHNQNTSDKAAVIYLHGNAATAHGIIPHFPFVREMGFSVYIPEYSGFGTNPGKATQANVIQDVTRMIKFARVEKPDRPIILMGWSLGGTLAVLAAEQEKVDGIVTIAAFTRTRDLAPFWAKPLTRGVPLDAGRAANSINVPWAIVHCSGDETIPFEMSNEFAQAAPDHMTAFQPICPDHAPHIVYWQRALADVSQRMEL